MAHQPHTLVLAGGGHAHIQLLINDTAYPPGTRRILVSEAATAVYSGMLPMAVAGLLPVSESVINLAALAARHGWEFICARVVRISGKNRTLTIAAESNETVSERVLHFTVLSLDIGSTTQAIASTSSGDDACVDDAAVVATRPIGLLVNRLERFEEGHGTATVLRTVIVGGGHAGVELAMATRARFARTLPNACVSISILRGSVAPAKSRAHRAVDAALKERNIEVLSASNAVGVDGMFLVLEDGQKLRADLVVLATGAASHRWVGRESDLAVDTLGFIVVDKALRCRGFPWIFAAGDCASFEGGDTVPKAGVYAVRAAPVLDGNIRRVIASPVGKEGDVNVVPWKPQKKALALLALGDGKAIGMKGRLVVQGRWVYELKLALDRRWQARFKKRHVGDWEGLGEARFEGAPTEAAALLWGDEKCCGSSFAEQYAVMRKMDMEEAFAEQVFDAGDISHP